MMVGRVMHWMMNDMTMMDDTPLMVHRMMNLRHRKAGQRQK
jgi:hypothetical protein